MTENHIAQTLSKLFDRHRIVFWYNPCRESRDDFEALSLPEITEMKEHEHEALYPLAAENASIDLDDSVKVNYPKFGEALKKIAGL